jgi:hypothetical protein
MALRIYRAADEQVQAGLPRVEHIVRRIVGYEGGAHRPRDPYLELYSRAFGIPRDVLFGPGGGEQPDRLPLAADGDGLATWISSSDTTDEAVDRIGQTVEDMDALLRGHRFAGIQQAASMREQIAAFTTPVTAGAEE